MFSNIADIQAFANNHQVLVFFIIAWSLVWKALALWKAARIGHKSWFVAFLLINLLGIPEIIYIYFIARKFKVESETAA
jgi:methionyl-tRNA synthetase